jgi:hypothetical protein
MELEVEAAGLGGGETWRPTEARGLEKSPSQHQRQGQHRDQRGGGPQWLRASCAPQVGALGRPPHPSLCPETGACSGGP